MSVSGVGSNSQQKIRNPNSGVAVAAEQGGVNPQDTLSASEAPPPTIMTAPKSAGAATGVFSRTVCAGMAGLMLATVLTGCNQAPNVGQLASQTATPETQAAVNNFFKAAEADKGSTQDVSHKVIDQIKNYATTSGKSMADITAAVVASAQEHPAVAITVLLGTGAVSGALLQQAGVPGAVADYAAATINGIGQATSNSADAVKAWVANNPKTSILIGAGLAVGVGYVVYEHMQPKAPVPQTEAQKQLVKSMDDLERQATAEQSGDAAVQSKDIQHSLLQTIQDYANRTGESSEAAAKDVGKYMISHPALSAAVILAAGTAGGIALQKAGVPASVATLATTMLASAQANGQAGLGTVTNAISNHPVVSAVVGTGLAAGAAYLLYEYAQPVPVSPVVP